MASENKTSIQQWFAGLSTPAKTLLIAVPLVAAAVAVAIIVVGGTPQQPTPMPVSEKPAAPSVEATEPVELPAGHPAIGSAASSETTAAPAASGSTGNSKSSASTKKSSSGTDDSESEIDDKTKEAADKIPADAERPPGELTDAWRLKIAREIVDGEQRAKREADTKYPTDPKNGGTKDNAQANEELRSRLVTEYTDAITAKYKLTSDELISILVLDAASLD